jgi:hypothetical protein
VPQDIKLEIKNAIESLLRDFKNIKTEQNPQKTLQQLPLMESKITTLQQNLSSLQTQSLIAVKNDIITTLKDLLTNLKDQTTNKNFLDIKNLFTTIDEKISPLIEQNITAKSAKVDLSNTLELFKSLNPKNSAQQQIVLQNIVNNTQMIQAKVETLPQALFENNLSKTANFINDLKITASVIEESIKNSNEAGAKELKTIIDSKSYQIHFE